MHAMRIVAMLSLGVGAYGLWKGLFVMSGEWTQTRVGAGIAAPVVLIGGGIFLFLYLRGRKA